MGPKEVSGKTAGNPLSISFFVREKVPERGQRRVLADGRRRLPKRIELHGTKIPTDVVVAVSNSALASANAVAPASNRIRAGGRISNGSGVGTFGCLASSPDGQRLYALTNHHVGIGPATSIYFPDPFIAGSVIGTTERTVGLVADEQYLGVIDKPGTFVDVDAALIAIPPVQVPRFSSDTPTIGIPSGIFEPDRSSFAAFSNSLLNREVFAFSWNSGHRTGRISHVYFGLRRLPDQTDSVASFLVASTDGLVPGIQGDSGKVWMTRDGDRTLVVGLHSGVVTEAHTGARFAIVADISSMARYMGFQLVVAT